MGGRSSGGNRNRKESQYYVQKLLNSQYTKIFDALEKSAGEAGITYKTMKKSGFEFSFSDNTKTTSGLHVTRGHEYTIKFVDKSFDFGDAGMYSTFNFGSKEAVGKFLFDADMNNGIPKGAVEVIDSNRQRRRKK